MGLTDGSHRIAGREGAGEEILIAGWVPGDLLVLRDRLLAVGAVVTVE